MYGLSAAMVRPPAVASIVPLHVPPLLVTLISPADTSAIGRNSVGSAVAGSQPVRASIWVIWASTSEPLPPPQAATTTRARSDASVGVRMAPILVEFGDHLTGDQVVVALARADHGPPRPADHD